MFRSLNLLLGFLVIGISVSAQLNAVSRARVQTTTATLQGYVRNRTAVATPQDYEFSETATGPFRPIGRGNLLRVELEDSTVLEQHVVRMAILPVPASQRQKSDYKPEVYVEGPVLLELLVEGTPALYGYTDSFQVAHFFYRSDSGLLEPIVYEPYEDVNDRGQFGYRNDLERLGIQAGCGDGERSGVRYVAYETHDMIRFFEQLNACGGRTARVVGRLNRRRHVVRAGLLAAGMRSSYYQTFPGGGADHVHSSGIIVGGWADFFPRRQNSNLMLGIAASMNVAGGNNGDGSKVLRIPFASVSYKEFSFDLVARRLFGASRARFFAEGGLAFSIVTGGVAHFIVESPTPNAPWEESSYGMGGTRTEAVLGGGVYFSLGSLHLRYHQPLVGAYSFQSRSVSLTARLALIR
ncbi:hypothetical protein [Flaviaesturariibacter aridisoli]|uniref:PorT family protein n=1 Tax=Flaviaesturariibacter aridisoli TaxID=2545761 RepID=A0A4R4E453_9BACT|nr:hypothetical protein [Flaviaesturariibacter aridisoli]TCZ73613.1 hypothetical protein E0486_04850 [Flaviaesturariibacter aridisoli]